MNTRNKLLSELDTSIRRLKIFSSPEFKGVYTNQYFKKIIKNFIDKRNETYSVIYGDFNKLGLINEVYGYEFGDKALRLSLNLIKQNLPKDAIPVRVGGDEFFTILPNCNKEQADEYCKNIHETLEQNSTLVGGLSIELATEDSEKGNIDELLHITDKKITEIKAQKNNNNFPADILSDNFLPLQIPENISEKEKFNWLELNTDINTCVFKFLQNFRPSKSLLFGCQQMKDASTIITTNLKELFNKKRAIHIDDDHTHELDSEKNNNTVNLSSSTCELIHSLVSGRKKINLNMISDNDITKLSSLMDTITESLITDKTSLFSKQYFNLYLSRALCNNKEPLAASYISTCGIKLANLASNHLHTDYRLDKTNLEFLENINKYIDYNKKPFNISKDDIHLISQGAGNYLFLYPKKLSNEIAPLIEKTVNETNKKYDMDDPDSTLKMSLYSTKENETLLNNTPEELINSINYVKEKTNSNKDGIKKDLFLCADSYIAFKKSIYNCFNYFVKNIPNAYTDINKEKIFMENIHRSFLNQEVLHNSTKFQKSLINPTKSNNNDIEYSR